MGIFSFLANAGRRLGLGGGSDPTPDALREELRRLGLPEPSVEVRGDTAVLTGEVPDAETRERVVLAVGEQWPLLSGGTLGSFSHLPPGSADIEAAQNTVHAASPANDAAIGPGGSTFHTVAKGDTLSAIAKRYYGDANAYPRIFEANR